eukprot:8231257-Pyramimonas_sp.AAC.1
MSTCGWSKLLRALSAVPGWWVSDLTVVGWGPVVDISGAVGGSSWGARMGALGRLRGLDGALSL